MYGKIATQYLWLDSDFYLPNSETPLSSRQTVVVEQIKARRFIKTKKYDKIIYLNYLIKNFERR